MISIRCEKCSQNFPCNTPEVPALPGLIRRAYVRRYRLGGNRYRQT